MADYRMRADFRARAPEVNPVQINPTIGMYQDGHGASLARFGRDISDISTAVSVGTTNQNKALLELQQKKAIGTMSLDLLDIGVENAIDAVEAEEGITFNDQQRAALREGQIEMGRFSTAALQNPRSALNSLRLVSSLRARGARNPELVPDFVQQYKALTGSTPLGQMESIIDDTEAARQKYFEYVDTEAFKLGMNSSVPFEQRAQLVSDRDQSLESLRQFNANYETMVKNDALNARSLKFRLRGDHSRDLVTVGSELINTITAELAKNDTSEARVAAMSQLNQFMAATVADTQTKFNAPGVDQADIDNALAPLQMLVNDTMESLKGDRDLAAVQTSSKLALAMAQDRILRENAGMPGIMAMGELFKDMPAFMNDLVGTTTFATDAAVIVRGVVTAVTDQASAAQLKSATVREGPEETAAAVRASRRTLSQVASDPKVPKEKFDQAVLNLFDNYNPNDEGSTRFFDGALSELATPNVLLRLAQERTPDMTNRLNKSFDSYINTVTMATKERVEARMNKWGPTLTPMDQPADSTYPWPKGSFWKLSLSTPINQYVESTVTPDGMPVFRAKEVQDPSLRADVNQSVRDMNSVAPRIQNSVKVLQALGLYTQYTPAELAEYLMTNGITPGYGEAAQRDQAKSAPNYGARNDGTQKGTGFLGELKVPGGVATEYSMQSQAVTKDGKQIDFPTLVPTLTPDEVDLMVNYIIPNQKTPPESIIQKAIAHANMRIAVGKDVFAQDGEFNGDLSGIVDGR